MGRKSWDKERSMHKLWDLAIPILVNALTDSKVKKNRRIDIALTLVTKMFPKESSIDLKTEATKLVLELNNGNANT